MNFINAMESKLNSEKTFTENGAVAYATSGKELLDFLFATTALRSADESEIEDRFADVFYSDQDTAVKFLFWMRDCRGGNGERRIFRTCFKWLCDNSCAKAKAVIDLIPEYGRWDDVLPLLKTSFKRDVLAMIKKYWAADFAAYQNGEPVSLFYKWMPSENASSRVTKEYANIIREYLGVSHRDYRRRLSTMRKYIDVVEVKMSSNKWSDINYATVPSKANLIYQAAFMKHDNLRRLEYLDALKNGEEKINAGVLQPHEIVRQYYCDSYRCVETNDTYEELWKALPDITIGNTLVVRDGSGSMDCTAYGSNARPLDVATALAIYMADHNTGVWKDKFITFSSSPRIVSLKNCHNLREKIEVSMHEAECSNTNIEATMDLILNTAIENKCKQEDMPANIVIVSDMQFDDGTRASYWSWSGDNFRTPDKSLFDEIAQRFKDAGYLMPRITFWNVRGQMGNTIPIQQNELGVVLISGFSIQLLEMVMSGETDPYMVVMETLNSERYAPIAEALEQLQ